MIILSVSQVEFCFVFDMLGFSPGPCICYPLSKILIPKLNFRFESDSYV